MSRLHMLILLTALITPTTGSADPLLSKAEIAKAAAKIDACLAEQAATTPNEPTSCVGIIKNPCDDAITAGGEAAHATCSDNETAAWDVLLNRRWAELASTIDRDQLDGLKSVQRLWLSYRDAKCAYLRKIDDSMMGYMAAADCRMDETSRRTLELLNLAG